MIGCCAFLPLIGYGLNVEDEGALLAQFYRVYAGDVPVRDVHMGYTPGAYYFHSALFAYFDVSTTVVRVALVVCHALLVALLFALGRRSLPWVLATLPPLVYCATMPFSPGSFASFNIPYPAWYTALFAVVSGFALVRFVESERARWLVLAGLAAGLSFSFKPNAGVFLLVSGALVMLLMAEPPRDRSARWWDVALWWLLALALAPAVVAAFGTHAEVRDLAIFVLPLAAILVMLVTRRLVDVGVVERRGANLGRAVVAYAGGALAPVLPWAVALLSVLGPALFARRVVFIGTGYERSYYLPFHAAGPADGALVLGALGVAVVGLLVRARRVRPATVGVVAVLGVLAAIGMLARARMPQGFALAVRSRAEDVSYTATLVVVWAGIAALVPPLLRRTGVPELRLFVVVVSALSSLLVVYPRSDFMHLVTALPMVLLLGALLVDRVVGWLSVSAALARALTVATVAATVGLSTIFIAPRVVALVEWNGGPALRPRAWLDLARAPIWLERGRAGRLRELRATVEYLRANTVPGESVFPFPAVELVCFLADRPNPTRFGYFFPGWPGHDVEAEVVTALRGSPPRLIVAVHAPQLYFHDAASYYYMLRADIERHYHRAARFGPYAVLARRESDTTFASTTGGPDVADVLAVLDARYGAALRGSSGDRVSALRALADERVDMPWKPLMALFDDADPSVRRAAFDAVVETTDPEVAFTVARAVAIGTVVPERREAALRLLHGSADWRSIAPLLAFRKHTSGRERAFVDTIVAAIVQKVVAGDYWFGSTRDDHVGAIPGIETHVAASALVAADEGSDRRRYVAWLAARGDRSGHLRRALGRVLARDEDPAVVAAAASALMADGFDSDVERIVGALIPLAGREPLFVPGLIVDLHRRAPATVVRAITEAMPTADRSARAELAWIIAASDDAAFRDTLTALQSAPDRGVRAAALFGLARLDGDDDWRRVEQGTRDSDVEVRALATRLVATRRVEPEDAATR